MKKQKHIHFEGEKVVSFDDDQSILEVSLSAGLPHYHACGGKALCSTCRVFVYEGHKNLSAPTKAELKLKAQKKFPDDVRLACQTKLLKNKVGVSRIIKDDLDAQLYVYQEGCTNNQSLGKEKELVLFFLDIRNFTPFIETNLPFDVIHIIKRLSALFRKIIIDNSGKIIEAAGDGFYAVFGLDKKLPKAITQAINSALKIDKEMRSFNKDYLSKYFETNLNVGIGIHVGNVIVGTNGFAGDNTMSVMGFPVNIASRLEQSTKELDNSIVVSETVYGLSKLKRHRSKVVSIKGSSPMKVRLMGQKYSS